MCLDICNHSDGNIRIPDTCGLNQHDGTWIPGACLANVVCKHYIVKGHMLFLMTVDSRIAVKYDTMLTNLSYLNCFVKIQCTISELLYTEFLQSNFMEIFLACHWMSPVLTKSIVITGGYFR